MNSSTQTDKVLTSKWKSEALKGNISLADLFKLLVNNWIKINGNRLSLYIEFYSFSTNFVCRYSNFD